VFDGVLESPGGDMRMYSGTLLHEWQGDREAWRSAKTFKNHARSRADGSKE